MAKPKQKLKPFLFEYSFDGRAHVGTKPFLNRVERGLSGQ